MSSEKNLNRNTKQNNQSSSMFDRLENFLNQKEFLIFWTIFVFHVLLCFFSFDPRLTGSNDDANYIEQGYKYAKDFTGYYYTSQAPLYPMFLAIPIALLGVNLIFLKVLTMLLNLIAFWFIYKLFKNAVSKTVLFSTLLIISVNYYFLYYSTHTFNETFFMVLQSTFLLFFIKFASKANNLYIPFFEKKSEIKIFPIRDLLLTAVFAVLLMIAKNAAIGIIMTYILYFAFKKQWKALFLGSISYALILGIWIFIRTLVWGDLASYGSQSNLLFQKHPYDASKGKVDTKGFIQRFTDNTQVYLSNRLVEALNIKSDETDGQVSKAKITMGYHLLNENDTDDTRMPFLVSKPVTFLIVIFLLLGMWVAYKNKQDALFASGIQTLVILGLTFLVVHVFWAQHRYLYIFVPVMLLLFFNMLWHLGNKFQSLQFILPLFTLMLFIMGLTLNDGMIKKQGRILSSAYANKEGISDNANPYKLHFRLAKALISGDRYSGITPDWKNYLKLCEWIGKNIPDTSTIAVRKPGEAFIYSGGRNFRGIYQVMGSPDSTLATFKREHIRFVVLSNFRLNQEKNDGNIINTIHRVLQPLEQAYPGTLKLVRKEGETEEAELYEIKY